MCRSRISAHHVIHAASCLAALTRMPLTPSGREGVTAHVPACPFHVHPGRGTSAGPESPTGRLSEPRIPARRVGGDAGRRRLSAPPFPAFHGPSGPGPGPWLPAALRAVAAQQSTAVPPIASSGRLLRSRDGLARQYLLGAPGPAHYPAIPQARPPGPAAPAQTQSSRKVSVPVTYGHRCDSDLSSRADRRRRPYYN